MRHPFEKASKPHKTTENHEKEVSFGGGSTRLVYEKEPSFFERIHSWLVSIGIAAFVLLALAGLITVATGSFSLTFGEKKEGGNSTALKVPTNAEISEAYKTPESVIAKAKESTVTVSATLEDGTESFQSGFFLSADGYLVTSSAMLHNLQVKEVSVYTEPFVSVAGDVVGIDSVLGIAVIKLQEGDEYPPLALGNSDFAKVGQSVYAVAATTQNVFCGYSAFGMISATEYMITNLNDAHLSEDTLHILCTDFSFNNTLLGAPLINADGQVLGVCTRAIPSPVAGGGCVIPVNTLVSLVREIIQENA